MCYQWKMYSTSQQAPLTTCISLIGHYCCPRNDSLNCHLLTLNISCLIVLSTTVAFTKQLKLCCIWSELAPDLPLRLLKCLVCLKYIDPNFGTSDRLKYQSTYKNQSKKIPSQSAKIISP